MITTATLPNDKTSYTITELAKSYNVSLRALRFYEQAGLLKPARVGIQSIYTSEDRMRLELILVGKRLKLSLRQGRN